MLGKTHQIGGACSVIVLGSFLFPPPLSPAMLLYGGVMVAGSTLGSLLPDIDHTQSKISQKAKITSHVVSRMMGHRGWTHTLLVFGLVTAILFFIVSQIETAQLLLYYAALGVSVGYLSHLLLDALTVSGIPAFKPFSDKMIRFARFKTGESDPGVQFLLIAGTIGVLYLQYFKQ